MKDRALVLDFGGVISRTLFETHDLTERALDLAPGTLTWRGPFDTAGDEAWRDMQAGRMSERDYWLLRTQQVGRLVGQDWARMEQFVVAARGADPSAVIRPEAVAAIGRAAAAGCRLAVLSNELDLFYGRELRQRMALLREVELIVDATYTGLLKPDPRAYGQCLQGLGLAAADCVFVDDQRRNVDGALRAGLRAVHFDVKAPARSFDAALALLGIASVASP